MSALEMLFLEAYLAMKNVSTFSSHIVSLKFVGNVVVVDNKFVSDIEIGEIFKLSTGIRHSLSISILELD